MSKKPTIDPDPDVIRTAWTLIRSHGPKAMREAARQQNAMIQRGDAGKVNLWWSVGRAI